MVVEFSKFANFMAISGCYVKKIQALNKLQIERTQRIREDLYKRKSMARLNDILDKKCRVQNSGKPLRDFNFNFTPITPLTPSNCPPYRVLVPKYGRSGKPL